MAGKRQGRGGTAVVGGGEAGARAGPGYAFRAGWQGVDAIRCGCPGPALPPLSAQLGPRSTCLALPTTI